MQLVSHKASNLPVKKESYSREHHRDINNVPPRRMEGWTDSALAKTDEPVSPSDNCRHNHTHTHIKFCNLVSILSSHSINHG